MKEKELIDIWKREESVAHIHGWDFSHIVGRYTEETDLPWNYQNIILDYLKPEMKLLDIDTGGGEFLLSLRHPYVKTSPFLPYIFPQCEKNPIHGYVQHFLLFSKCLSILFCSKSDTLIQGNSKGGELTQ